MNRARTLSEGLVAGTVAPTAWRVAMSSALKIAHLEGAAVAKGGWAQLSQSDYDWTGSRVRSQLGYLQKFYDDILYGRTPLDGSVTARATMYVEAGRGTQRSMERRMAIGRGEELERNVGGDSESSCDECADCDSAGWVPIGSLPEPGSRQCLSRCSCWLIFRTDGAAA